MSSPGSCSNTNDGHVTANRPMYRPIQQLISKSDGLYAYLQEPGLFEFDSEEYWKDGITIGPLEHIVEVAMDTNPSEPGRTFSTIGSKLNVWIGEPLDPQLSELLGFDPVREGRDQLFEVSTASLTA